MWAHTAICVMLIEPHDPVCCDVPSCDVCGPIVGSITSYIFKYVQIEASLVQIAGRGVLVV
jgi:hypothetical protein